MKRDEGMMIMMMMMKKVTQEALMQRPGCVNELFFGLYIIQLDMNR